MLLLTASLLSNKFVQTELQESYMYIGVPSKVRIKSIIFRLLEHNNPLQSFILLHGDLGYDLMSILGQTIQFGPLNQLGASY